MTSASFLVSHATRHWPLALAGVLAHVCAQAQVQDLTSMPFEQLLSMEVYSASKFVQKASQAPASVTVVTAADIRDYGWRTLADVARSVRGLYVSYDRNYSYLGERGFLRPGDYNTRFLLQIDGNRVNDGVYDQAPLGAEFALDLELIERIEFVPGPGSSIYGSNAFFGVINVITKKGAALAGVRAAVEGGGAGYARVHASAGWRGADGASYALAASRARSAGRDLYYPEFDTPGQSNGVAHALDGETASRVFASVTRGGFSASAVHAERVKGVPTASFGQAFDDPRSRTTDRQSYLNAAWQVRAGASEQLSMRAFWGSYDSYGNYVADDAARTLDHDGSAARWWGAEVNLVSSRFQDHTVLAGFELQRDYSLRQYSYDVAPYHSYLDDRRAGSRAGLYVQDEVAVTDALRLTLGVRYDRDGKIDGVFSPRAALVYALTPDTTLKAMHGSAFRAPNSYELYYSFPGAGGQLDNPDLRKEHIVSSELALVRRIGPDARVSASLFSNSVTGLITQVLDADSGLTRFDNAAPLRARGVELELERGWANGASLRASYSWTRVGPDPDHQQIDAPAHLAKLNLAAPLGAAGLRAAIEAQYVGARQGLNGVAGAYWVANANLICTRLPGHAEASLAVTNLFDRRYADPGSAEHLQRTLVQDGRRLRLRVDYAF